MKKIVNILVLTLALFFVGCSLFSIQDISNDFKWKNKKFKEDVLVGFSFNPYVSKLITKKDAAFFLGVNTDSLVEHYQIEKLFNKKFKARNIDFKLPNRYMVRIDTLLFKESAGTEALYTHKGYVGTEDVNDFEFEIKGSVIDNKTGECTKVFVNKRQSTSLRESSLFKGHIVTDGLADTRRMIENTINKFSYEVYKVLVKMKAQENQQES